MDLGSNSFRLMILGRDECGYISIAYEALIITGLSQGCSHDRKITPQAMQKSLDALHEFVQKLDKYKVNRRYFLGTSALREAKNSQQFLDLARKELKICIQVIEPEQEATLSYQAARHSLDLEGSCLVADIGGGSTELIFGTSTEPQEWLSTNLGVVKLKEEFLPADPPKKVHRLELQSYLLDKMRGIEPIRESKKVSAGLIIVGGTATTAVAMLKEQPLYIDSQFNNIKVPIREIDRLIHSISPLTCNEILRRYPVPRGREPYMLPGLILIRCLMDTIGSESLVTCSRGYLYGYLLQELVNENKEQ